MEHAAVGCYVWPWSSHLKKDVADQQRFREGQQGCSEPWDASEVVPKAKALGSSAGEGGEGGCDGSLEASREGGWVRPAAVSSTRDPGGAMAVAAGRHAPEQDIWCLTWQIQAWVL